MSNVKRQRYECSNPKCDAEDFVKLWPHEIAPMVINCHKCRAGRKMEVNDMLMKRIGMFPVITE